MKHSFFARNPSVVIFIACLAVFTLLITLLSNAYGISFLSTSVIKTLGKTLCLCLVAVAMDLIWGYAGILSLGHMASFAIGGYMVGMWLMYARTEAIVLTSLQGAGLPATPEEIQSGVTTQIFGVVGASDLPAIWSS
jgi:urea transport system permease protein